MKFEALSLMLVLLTSISGFSQVSHHDHPSTHGMLMVGKNEIYLSHLPMFHNPHDYQVIFKVRITATANAKYLASLNGSSETVYTLVPESFVLPEMVEHPRPFKAEIYKGHFERGGQVIANNVTVEIEKLIYFKKFVPGESKPAVGKFLLFGSNAEPFAAHLITSKPDFDQISRLQPLPHEILQMDSDSSRKFSVSSSEPLQDGSLLSAEIETQNQKINLDVQKSLYFETGDLAF
jgi:hypothetical protein